MGLFVYAKDSEGKIFVDSVLNSMFWKECTLIVRMTEPLVRVLQIIDNDDRLAMGCLYEAIHSAKEKMLRRFQKRRIKVQAFPDIINNRWDG
jgi:hypothetical protein